MDFYEIFLLVVKVDNIRSIIVFVIYRKWDIFLLDIDNIFLYGDFEEVYMKGFKGVLNLVIKYLSRKKCMV